MKNYYESDEFIEKVVDAYVKKYKEPKINMSKKERYAFFENLINHYEDKIEDHKIHGDKIWN